MSQFSQASILIVDQDAESLFTMAAILIAQNHRVFTASDAAAAIELAQIETLDLLITDVRLGRWSGLELITTIQLNPEKRDLPVMFVSAHQSPGVMRRTYESGDAFHVRKPIEPQVLSELVEKALWMPHLVKNHIEQESIQQPHASFAPTPLASPFGASSIFPGTPISF